MPRAAGTPPPVPAYAQRGVTRPVVYSDRNRWVAGALGILLGVFGVHRFYLGYVGIGVTQLLLGILSFGIISSIWGWIDGILCFCGSIDDADGLPLRG
jgi:TM2 domain-containing membrane protein YozV